MQNLTELILNKNFKPINKANLNLNKIITFLTEEKADFRIAQIYADSNSREKNKKAPLLFHNKIITYTNIRNLIINKFGKPNFSPKEKEYDTKKEIYTTKYPRDILNEIFIEKEIFTVKIDGSEIIGKTSIIYGNHKDTLNTYIYMKQLNTNPFK